MQGNFGENKVYRDWDCVCVCACEMLELKVSEKGLYTGEKATIIEEVGFFIKSYILAYWTKESHKKN